MTGKKEKRTPTPQMREGEKIITLYLAIFLEKQCDTNVTKSVVFYIFFGIYFVTVM